VTPYPKIELHVHLEGTVRAPTLLEIAKRNDYALPTDTVEGLQELYRLTDFRHFIDVWILTTNALRTADDFRRVVVDYAAEAAAHGAVYIEGIFSPAERVRRDVSWDEIFTGYCDGADEARERHGVEARVADGSITAHEFETLKRRFTAGEFPVLCLSRIGHEGHNLQNASVLCHLDLPWLPSGLEQRVGRAARPGAARAHVQTYIPYIRRGGIERVVSVLAARGAEHHQILDSFEGVHAAESTVATQLSEITGQVADSKDHAGYAATAARLRVAASVFGN